MNPELLNHFFPGHSEVKHLELSGCSGSHCVIHKGKDFMMTADLVSNQDTKKVHVKIVADVGGLKLPIPGVDEDGCKHIKCPLTKGEEAKFTYSMNIPKLIPNIKAHVIATLSGDHGVMACVNVDGEVKN